jgi:hypothetical protein
MGQAVSIVQLIATPEKYDGKVVLVGGFLRLEFEGDAIYLHEDDYRHGIYANGLWVNLDAKNAENSDKINLHYAFVEGTFDASRHGHGGLFAGTINNITYARIASSRHRKPDKCTGARERGKLKT